MSSRLGISYLRMIVAAFGLVLITLGGILTYFSLIVEGSAPTRFFTPLGLLVAILGIVLLLVRDY